MAMHDPLQLSRLNAELRNAIENAVRMNVPDLSRLVGFQKIQFAASDEGLGLVGRARA